MEALFVKYISQKFAAGKRPHELELLALLMQKRQNLLSRLKTRKNKDDKEAKSFYYLGQMHAYRAEPITMQGTQDKAVELYWQLDTAVREDIFDYLTSAEA